MTVNEKERLLCYAAGLLGSTLANPNHTTGISDWLVKRSIRKAAMLIDCVFDDAKLAEILNENPDGGTPIAQS